MKKIVLIFILFSLINNIYSQCNYYSLGPNDHAEPSCAQTDYSDVAINSNGILYWAFQDNSIGGKCTVKKYNGSSWEIVGTEGISTGPANFIRLAIDTGGVPYVIYSDYGNAGRASVKKYNGSSWVLVGNQHVSMAEARYTDIDIDSNGTPYVAYTVYSGNTNLEVKYFDGVSWVTIPTPGILQSPRSSIALDRNGAPYVLCSRIFQSMEVRKYNGTSWINIDPGNGGVVCLGEADIDLDSADVPYIIVQGISNQGRTYKHNGTSWQSIINAGGSSGNRIVAGSGQNMFICYSSNGTNGYVRRYNGTAWNLLTTFTGQTQSIAVDLNNNPIVSCNYEKAKVLNYNGLSWDNLSSNGLTAGGQDNESILALDKNNTPYVVYKDQTNTGGYSLKKYSGTSWTNVGLPNFAGGYTINLKIDTNNTPYVAYRESGPVNGNKASVRKFDGTSWQYVGPPAFTNGGINGLSFDIDHNNTPYVVFKDATNNSKCTVMKYTGSAWVYVGSPGFSSNLISDPEIAIDPTGIPYVIYVDYASGAGVCTVMKFNGATWINVGSIVSLPGIVGYTHITFDNSGIPYIVFLNNNKCTVMKYIGNTWIPVGTPGFGILDPGKKAVIAINSIGTPYVMYADSTNYNKSAIMKFNGTAWVNVGNSGFSAAGIDDPNLAITTSGKIYASYTSGGIWVYNYDETDISVKNTAVCTGDNLVFNSIGTFTSSIWSGPNSFVASTPSATITNFQSINSGIYTLSTTSGLCSSTQTINVILAPNPTITATPTNSICEGVSVNIIANGANTYTWSTGATTNSITETPNATSIYTVVGADLNNCTDTVSVQVFVAPSPTLAITTQSVICDGFTTNINVNGADTYTWSTGATTNSIAETPSVTTTYSVAGTYTINNCVRTITTQIVVNPIPTVAITSNSILCEGNSLTIAAAGANTYTWSTGATTNSIIETPNVTTTYSVIGINSNNCIGTASTQIIVNPSPIVSVISTNSVCIGTSANISASGADSYIWNTGATTNSITEIPTVTATYTVTGTDLNNCSNTQTVNITVDNTCADVWPGDANSDGTADNLDVLELGLHYTQTGASRTTTSNTWQSYFANNWIGTISSGKNLNHSDCNGDGTINDNDTLAIYNNYGLTHAFKATETTTVNPKLSIVPDQNYVDKGNWGTASINLGEELFNMITNINGVAFTIDFDNTLIEADSIFIEYQNSFLDVANQNLDFRKLDFANGKIYTATTHTINNNVSGYGKIASLHYKIKSSLSTDAVLNLSLTQANQSNASGSITPLSAGSASLMAIGASVGLTEFLNSSYVSINPNPTNGHVVITSTTDIEKIEVVTLTGQLLISENVNAKSYLLNLEGLANSVYFVKVYNSQKQVSIKKLVVQK